MTDITASAETLMRQAGYTAEVYMNAAIESIDKWFGKGFAAKNPQLVGDFMKTAAMDYGAAILSQQIGQALEEISGSIQTAIPVED